MKTFERFSRFQIGVHILRLGLAAVFLWFGFSQLIDSINWVYLVPQWASDLLNIPPAMIVLGNGLMEVILGAMLAMGFWVRLISFILGLHLMPIAYELGFTAIGVRDFGLIAAAIALSLLYEKGESVKRIEPMSVGPTTGNN